MFNSCAILDARKFFWFVIQRQHQYDPSVTTDTAGVPLYSLCLNAQIYHQVGVDKAWYMSPKTIKNIYPSILSLEGRSGVGANRSGREAGSTPDSSPSQGLIINTRVMYMFLQYHEHWHCIYIFFFFNIHIVLLSYWLLHTKCMLIQQLSIVPSKCTFTDYLIDICSKERNYKPIEKLFTFFRKHC